MTGILRMWGGARLWTVVAVSVLFSSGHVFAQGNNGTAAAEISATDASARVALVDQLVANHGDHLLRSRYMEKNCEPVAWPGWEGLPTLKCTYVVTDQATKTTKSAEIILLDAAPKMIANWVVTACHDAGSTEPAKDADKLFKHIISQSGGQFPIAGVVYEDMEGDGFMKAYCFRNGVTVRVAGFEHRTTATLSPAEVELSLRGPIERIYTYARIASTTPDQYRAAGGNVDVGTNKERKAAWPQVVGEIYKRAWNSDRNALISAWAKGNL